MSKADEDPLTLWDRFVVAPNIDSTVTDKHYWNQAVHTYQTLDVEDSGVREVTFIVASPKLE